MEFIIYAISCFGLGALHAIEPGHGKTVVGAYLVGSRGRAIDAVILGIVVTLAHTSIIIILGILSIVAANYFAPDKIHHILELVSGIIIVGVGVWMIIVRIRQARRGHQHNHNHNHNGHHTHHNLDSITADRSLRLGGLVALGISGGIVPCPAALAVLLTAISVRNFFQGTILVIIFSMGMAMVLVAIGILLLKATSLAERVFKKGNWIKILPILSACIITLLGVGLTIKALFY